MANDVEWLLWKFDRRPAAAEAAIAAMEEALGAQVPEEYRQFLKLTNGGDGYIGDDSFAVFWSLQELAPRNEVYEIAKRLPGLLAIGTDGSTCAYAFDTRAYGWPIVKIPFKQYTLEAATVVAPTFIKFLKALYAKL